MNFGIALERLPLVDLFGSVILFVILVVLRYLAIRFIEGRTEAAPHVQRRWITTAKNLFLFLLLVGLALIWAPQLRTFALSLTAVAVALVVATKELILCFSGSFLRASSRTFAVGDWIEVAGVRGEVVDHNIFVTTLQEIDGGAQSYHYTGRTAVLPNSAFLGAPLRNHSFLKNYMFHTFVVTVDPTVNVFAERDMILGVVNRHFAPHRDEAVRNNALIERRTGVDLVDPEERVRFSTSDLGKYRITVTLFCPTRIAEALESAIVCELMGVLHERAQGSTSPT